MRQIRNTENGSDLKEVSRKLQKLPQLSEPDGEVFDEKDFDYFQRELPRCLGNGDKTLN
jgi:hypothetical protein